MNRNGMNQEAMKRFGLIVGSVVSLFVIVAASIFFIYGAISEDGDGVATKQPIEQQGEATPPPGQSGEGTQQGGIGDLFTPPNRTTALVMGLDEDGLLADVQMLVTFDAVNNRVDVVQVPRDTYVMLPQAEVRSITQTGRYCPSDGVMKLNELHSYAGTEKGHEYVQRQMERMFGIQIDYYVTLDPAAFRSVVDAIDGVWFEVRAEGYYNPMELQDLTIAIAGGYQKLDGHKAEMVVRFREGVNPYPDGDLGRMKVQRAFMQAMVEQVMEKETLMSNLPRLLSTLISYVKTDFGIDSIPRYLTSIEKVSVESIHFHQLTGSTPTIGGTSYFVQDAAATEALIYEVFHKNAVSVDAGGGGQMEAADMKVRVLNGGAAAGAAGRVRDELQNEGFQVVDTGNYDGTQRTYTRIFVREGVDGSVLEKYFASAEVEVDNELPAAYDVVIILGKND